eukprot:6970316-Ditylum_brightwellii.AAC.1
MYSDADLTRELRERSSTTPIALLTTGIIKVSDICNFSSTIGYSIREPSTVYEDNAGAIKAITAVCTTPTHIYHDVKISTVIYHKQKGTILVEHSKSELMLAGPNTKPHGGKNLRMKTDRLIGARFYPPQYSVKYDL